MGCKEEPDRDVGDNHEAVVADGRIPKIPKKAGDEDGTVEDEEGVLRERALPEGALLEGDGIHFGPGFVGGEPEAPPSWGWIHLREQLLHLLHETFPILSFHPN